MKKFTTINFENRTYKVKTENIFHIVKILENKKLNSFEKNGILNIFAKYGLFDEIFLENINKI